MASVKNGLSENIKGRLGNVIFYSRLGRTYARLRPPKGHDPCTVLQQQQRSRMKDVTLFYKVVRQSPLAGIWRQAAYAQGMTGINLFRGPATGGLLPGSRWEFRNIAGYLLGKCNLIERRALCRPFYGCGAF